MIGQIFPLLLRVRRELRRVGRSHAGRRGAGLHEIGDAVSRLVRSVASRDLQENCSLRLICHPAKLWRRTVLELWRGAKFREERYVAIALTGDKRAAAFQTPIAMPIYEEIIVTGAWWDYVDDVAAHRVGTILRDYPAPMRKKMLAWSTSPNMWKRRTSIICQLGFKQDTDLDLLYACIEPSLDSKEFFLRKAIGWALRQYAWTDPAEIRRYVREQ